MWGEMAGTYDVTMDGGPFGFFEIANYVEAGVWVGMAVWCAVRGYRRGQWRTWVLAGVLVIFGVSDVVEVRTGAWYRPWWLLVWKGVCVGMIVWLLVAQARSRGEGP